MYPAHPTSNVVGLQLNEHKFDILGKDIQTVAQFGSTLNETSVRIFTSANSDIAYGLTLENVDSKPKLSIGPWSPQTQSYTPQIQFDESGVEIVSSLQLPDGDIYFAGNLGVGTRSPLGKVHLEGYNMDVNGTIYATGTIFASNLVIYGDSVLLQTTTCNTEQFTIDNSGTGPALVVTQTGSGTQFAIAEFRDGDMEEIAMIIADGGNVGIGTRYPFQELDVRGSLVVSQNVGIGTLYPLQTFQVSGGDAAFLHQVGIGTLYPTHALDVRVGDVYVNDNVGIGTTQPRQGFEVAGKDAIFGEFVGIGTLAPRVPLDVVGVASISANIGIGTLVPLGALHVFNGDTILAPNVGIGSTQPLQQFHLEGTGYISASLGIGTTLPLGALHVESESTLLISNVGMGTTTPRQRLDVASGNAIIASGNLGIGTLTPRKALDVMGDAIFSANIGIGTTIPLAPLHLAFGPILLDAGPSGNLGIGTRTPTNPLHIQDTVRIANKRMSYRLPLSSSSQVIQFFKYQYTSFAPFYIRIHGQVYSSYNSMFVDIHFGGRYGYGVRTQHANIYGNLKNLVNNDVSSAFQVRFYKKAGTDEYFGYLVFNDGSSESIGIDLNFDVHYGEDTFTWSGTSLPQGNDYSVYWNATEDAQRIEYDTAVYHRDPIGVGTTSPSSWLHVVGLSSTTLPMVTVQSKNALADYVAIAGPLDEPVLTIPASANVGIGSRAPAAKLDVAGDAHVDTVLFVGGQIGIGTNTPRKSLDVVGDVIATANIGVGTTTPRHELDVVGRAIISSAVGIGASAATPRQELDVTGTAIFSANVGVGTTTPRQQLDIEGKIIASTNIGIGTTQPRDALDVIGQAIVTANLGLGTTTPLHKLHVEGYAYVSGNVGVGTIVPERKLTIWTTNSDADISNSDILIHTQYGSSQINADNLTGGGIALRLGTQDDPAPNVLARIAYGARSNMYGTGSDDNGVLLFETADAGVLRTTMFLTGDGRVGMGTTEPRKTLDVIGDIIATGLVGIGTTLPRHPMDIMGSAIVQSSLGIGTTTVPRASLDVIGDAIVSANVGVGTVFARKALDVIGDGIFTTNIGIGTTGPRKTLDVMGSAYIHDQIGIGTLSPQQYSALDVNGSIVARENVIVGQTQTVGYKSIQADGDDIIIKGQLAVAGVEGSAIYKLGVGYAPPSQGEGTLIANANVGIGTTAPRTKLDVMGGALINGNIGIGTTIPVMVPLAIYDTSAILLPKGTTNDRPGPTQTGYIRYNTTTEQFEGFGAGDQWGSLGGVKDVNGDTFISAELAAGVNDDILRFINSNTETMRIMPDGNVGIGTIVPHARLHVLHAGTGPGAGTGDIVRIDDSQVPNTTPFLIAGNGFVGMGTTLAVERLVVNGNMRLLGSLHSVDTGVTIDPLVTNGTSPSYMRVFRDVNTTGSKAVHLHRGVAGPTADVVDTQFGVDGLQSFINASFVGIGTTDPRQRLHVSNGDLVVDANIGIGTIAVSAAKFHVRHNANHATMRLESTNNSSNTIVMSDRVNSVTNTLIIRGIGGAFELEGPSQKQMTHVDEDNHVLYTNALERVRVTSSGVGIGTSQPRKLLDVLGDIITSTNIGIGTTTPAHHFHVEGDSLLTKTTYIGNTNISITQNASGNLQVTNTVQGKSVNVAVWNTTGARDAVIVSPHAANGDYAKVRIVESTFELTTGSKSTLFTDLAGNIGIGTSSPRNAFDVSKGDAIFATNIGIGTTLPRKALDVTGDIIASTNVGVGTAAPRAALDIVGEGLFTANIGIGTLAPRHTLDVAVGSAIVAVGNLGVGTTTPRNTLDIAGSALISGNVGMGTTLAEGRLHVHGDVNIQTGSVLFMDADPGVMVEKFYASGDRYGMGQFSGGILRSYVADTNATSSYRVSRFKTDGSFSDMLTVNQDGNLGVGKTAPGERVDVEGAVRISNGLITAKDAFNSMSFPRGIVRRKFNSTDRLSSLGHPLSADDMKIFFQSQSGSAGLVYIDSTVHSDISQSGPVGGSPLLAYEFIGFIFTSEEGTYEFAINSDDASELYIDGKRVSDYYGGHTAAGESVNRSIYLNNGLHTVVARIEQGASGGTFEALWKTPAAGVGAGFVTIPATAFHYDPNTLLHTVGDQLTYTQGNIGIGTLVPRKLLDVMGDAIVSTNVGIGTTLPRASLDVQDSSHFHGNVGLGSTLPTERLHVEGTVFVSDTVRTPTLDTATIFATNIGIGTSTILAPLHVNADAIITQNLGIGTTTPRQQLDVIGVLVASQNIGIGTVTPANALDIYGNQYLTGALRVGTDANGTANLTGTALEGTFGQAYYVTTRSIAPEQGLIIENSDPSNNFAKTFIARFDKDGNVGIGTMLPRQMLDVQAGITSAFVGIGTTIVRGQALDVEGTAIISAHVGIGTLAPRQALDVIGDVVTSANIGVGIALPRNALDVIGDAIVSTNIGIGTTTPRRALDVSTTGIFGSSIGIGTTSPKKALDVMGDIIGSTNLGIGTTTPRQSLDIVGNAIASGFIGIGTAYPTEQFHIRSSLPTVFLDTTNPNGEANVIKMADNASLRLGSESAHKAHVLVTGNSQSSPQLAGRVNVRYTNYVGFDYVNGVDASTTAERMRILNDGNVGIGITDAKEKLHVDGFVRSAGLTAQRAIVSDASKNIVTSTTTATQIGYLSDTTSAIQAQIDSKLFLAGGTIDGNLVVNSNVYAFGTMFASNLQILGDFTTLNTLTSNTDQLIIRNDGTGPALHVIQSGPQAVAEFYDNETGISLLIDNDGRVGIGTGIPTHTLHVDGNVYALGNLGIGTSPRMALDVQGDIIGSSTLGIGTTTPRAALDVMGTALISEGVGIGTTMVHSDLTHPHTLQVWGNAMINDMTTGNPAAGVMGGDGTRLVLWPGTDGAPEGASPFAFGIGMDVNSVRALWYGVADDADQVWYSGTRKHMHLTASGNLGIGTQSGVPHRLTVNGNASVSGPVMIGGQSDIPSDPLQGDRHLYVRGQTELNSNVMVSNGNITVMNGGGAFINFMDSVSDQYDVRLGSVSNTDLMIETGGNGSTSEKMRITGAGFVGIGTSTPRRMLDIVDGDAIISGLVGMGTTTPLQKLHIEGSIYCSGNIGLGTTTPTADLDIFKSLVKLGEGGPGKTTTLAFRDGLDITQSETSNTRIQNTGQTSYIQFYNKQGDYRFSLLDGSQVSEYDAMVIQGSSGNVGIGTAIPVVSLDIHATDSVLLPKGTTAQRPPSGHKGFVRYNTDMDQFEGFGAGSTWGTLGGVKSTDQLTFISAELTAGANDSNLRFYTSGDIQMIVNPNGNVGIGTTNPRQRLHVDRGNAIFTGAIGIGTLSPGANGTSLYVNGKFEVAGGTSALNGIEINGAFTSNTIYRASAGQSLGIACAGDDPITFTQINQSSPMERMRIATGGNVGIGTTAPRQVLDIQGSMIAPVGSVGIGTTTMVMPFEVWDTSAMLIPVGADGERPSGPLRGYMRYNTTTDQFEGFGAGNQWGSLGGVKDVNGDTFVAAELAPAVNDDNLRFVTSNIEQMRIDRYGNIGIGTDLPHGLLHLYDRDPVRQTVLVEWDSSIGKRYTNIKVPVNNFIDPVALDTNNAFDLRTNGASRFTIEDTGVTSKDRLFLSDGAQNNASITFTNDTSTGMFLAETNTLAFTTSNVEKLRINQDGNVGIGCDPVFKLEVHGNVSLGKGLEGTSDSTQGGPFFKQNSWDEATSSHTIPWPAYCGGENSAGTLHIQVSNKLMTSNAKIGNMMVSFIKRIGDNVNIFTISHHTSPQLTTFSITSSGADIHVTTDSDCSISWTSIGSF